MTRSIGIDLGTTNSCVATIDDRGHPRIIPNALGERTTPSVVAFSEAAEAQVGSPAKRMAVLAPEHTVFGVKRFIGRRYDHPDVEVLARTLPYRLTPAPNGDAWVKARDIAFPVPEISARILAELKRVAEEDLGGSIDEAIITVPAHFDHEQRQATKDAAAIAGLEVRRLVNEPTAAALGYGAHRGANRRFAVCDLGGGTFDVSIVNVEDGVLEVIASDGDMFLGGNDFDAAIIAALSRDVADIAGVDVTADPAALSLLMTEAQNAKHALSEVNQVDIHLPHLGARPYQRTLTREAIEAWTAPILDRLEPPCRESAARCGLALSDIDAIILVGGMTRMPAVQARIQRIFGRPPLKVVNPDEIVAVGAATQCAILDGLIDNVVLLDVTSRALGIAVGGGPQLPVIAKNATIPTREYKIVATTEDDQRELLVDVYEGESANPRGNRLLGRFVCCDLPPAPAGQVLVLVELTVDVDGILSVSATEMASGRAPELRLRATAGLTRTEVARRAQMLLP